MGMSALTLSSGKNFISGVYRYSPLSGKISSAEIAWLPPSGRNPIIRACGLDGWHRLDGLYWLDVQHWLVAISQEHKTIIYS